MESVFSTIAREKFEFLISEFGYKLEESLEDRVTFVSNRVIIMVTYSRNEVDIWIDRNPPEKSFQFVYFIAIKDREFVRSLGYGIASGREAIEKELDLLARVLRSHCEPLMTGDPKAFALVDERRRSGWVPTP